MSTPLLGHSIGLGTNILSTEWICIGYKILIPYHVFIINILQLLKYILYALNMRKHYIYIWMGQGSI